MVAGDEQQTLSVSGGRPTRTRHLPAVWDSAPCPRAVLDAEDPDWSPDGSSIVFVRVATELGRVFGYRSVTRASV